MIYDMIIVGGGAAGLCAAYTASKEDAAMQILVIEKESVCGRKLSASGNGKGNITNAAFGKEWYHSGDAAKAEEWVQAHSYEEVLDFFHRIGIVTYEKNGYYYPFSNQAKQVTNLLYDKCRENRVTFQLQTEIAAIHKKRIQSVTGYELTDTKGARYECTHLLLCTGGAAAPKLGGSRSGYQLVQKLSHMVRPVHSVLRPIYVEDALLKYAKGVRMDGTVTLHGTDGVIARETGQIQWNEDNLSGIVMMNLSCYIPDAGQEIALHMDLLPDWNWNTLKEYIQVQAKENPEQTIYNLLLGVFPAGMVRYLLRRLRIEESVMCRGLTDKQINRITSHIKKLTFQPVWKEDYDKAQVTAGGVPLTEIDLHTMESKKNPNLYLTGELLDMNGCCGGYNLTFAILSGIQAAHAITGKRNGWRQT